MKFYFFHRPVKLPVPQFKDPRDDNEMTPQCDKNGKVFQKTQSVQYRSVTHDETSITIELGYEYNPRLGPNPVKGTIEVKPWECYSILLHGTYSMHPRMVFNNRTSVSECAMRGDGHDMLTYIGCVLFTDTEAMLFLRNYADDVQGFDNIHLLESESSEGAFSRISEKADTLIRITKEKRKAMESIDYVGTIATLTTQVDFLTQLVIQAGLVDEPKVAEDLMKATREDFLLHAKDLAEEKEKLYSILLRFSERKKNLTAPRVDPYKEPIPLS